MEPVSDTGSTEIGIQGLPADGVLLDVREDEEWNAGHAPGAVHVPITELAARLDEVPDATPVYVVCRSGGRSSRAAEYLNANGWDAVNVVGGMSAWSGLGRPLVSETAAAPEII